MVVVKDSITDRLMRLCTAGFLERISFDEVYINEVEKYKKNKKQYDIANLLKEIRRSN